MSNNEIKTIMLKRIVKTIEQEDLFDLLARASETSVCQVLFDAGFYSGCERDYPTSRWEKTFRKVQELVTYSIALAKYKDCDMMEDADGYLYTRYYLDIYGFIYDRQEQMQIAYDLAALDHFIYCARTFKECFAKAFQVSAPRNWTDVEAATKLLQFYSGVIKVLPAKEAAKATKALELYQAEIANS